MFYSTKGKGGLRKFSSGKKKVLVKSIKLIYQDLKTLRKYDFCIIIVGGRKLKSINQDCSISVEINFELSISLII